MNTVTDLNVFRPREENCVDGRPFTNPQLVLNVFRTVR